MQKALIFFLKRPFVFREKTKCGSRKTPSEVCLDQASTDTVYRLAKVLGCSIEDLLER